jgi:hypothetical protein
MTVIWTNSKIWFETLDGPRKIFWLGNLEICWIFSEHWGGLKRVALYKVKNNSSLFMVLQNDIESIRTNSPPIWHVVFDPSDRTPFNTKATHQIKLTNWTSIDRDAPCRKPWKIRCIRRQPATHPRFYRWRHSKIRLNYWQLTGYADYYFRYAKMRMIYSTDHINLNVLNQNFLRESVQIGWNV